MKSFLTLASIIYTVACISFPSCKKKNEIQPIVITPNKEKIFSVNYSTLIAKQVAYILSCQQSSGAILDVPLSSGGNKITGYFANVACMGLLANPTSENIAAVKKWIIWYINHLNGTANPITGGAEIAGSVYDYYGSAESTFGKYDSVDSYAATFLTLVKLLAEASPADIAWLASYSYQLNLIGNALTTCFDVNDGLTITSNIYPTKYTMDNAETNQGLKAMVWLQNNVLTSGDPAYYSSVLLANTNGIENNLWNPTRSNYDVAKGINSTWTTWYADATCQLYPATLNVIPAESQKAIDLYNTFNSNFPSWSTGRIYDAGGFPWAVVSYASARMNDLPRTNEYLNYLQTNNGFLKNWYTFEAGTSILAAKIMSTVSGNLALNKICTASSNSSSANLANDGDTATTKWSSSTEANQWWKLDLGGAINISKVVIYWDAAYAKSFTIQTSKDDITYTNSYSTTSGTGSVDEIYFLLRNARYVKILCQTSSMTDTGYSIFECRVY